MRGNQPLIFVRILGFILLGLALVAVQALIGGARLVYGLPSYIVVALAGLCLAFVFPRATESSKMTRVCVGATLLFAAYICLRAWFSPVEYQARYDFFMTLGCVIAYLAAALHLRRTQDRLVILAILFGGALIHVASGVVQFQRGDEYMLLPWIFRPGYGIRASGFYICPNHLAGLLEMLALIGLSICCWAKAGSVVRILMIWCVAVFLGGLAITGSRGGYFSIAVGLLVFGGLSLRALWVLRRGWVLPALFAGVFATSLVAGAGVMAMLRNEGLRAKLYTMYDPKNMRLMLYSAALKQHSLSPAIGTGAGTYIYFGRQFRDPFVQNDPIHVHSDYLELLAEYGYAGIGLAVIFLGVHGYSGLRGFSRSVRRRSQDHWSVQDNDLALSIGVPAAVAALLAHSLVDFNLHIPANALVYAFFLGILASPASGEDQQAVLSSAWRFLAPATAVLLLVFGIPLVRSEYHGELARIALRDRGYETALAESEQAIATDRKNPELYYYRGEAKHFLALAATDPRRAAELHASAADDFAQGLVLFPQDVRLLLKLGRTLDNLGRFPEAAAIYDQAVKADPNFGNVYANLGLHWQLRGEVALAAEYYAKAQSLGEYELSSAGLKDLEQVKARERRVLELMPELISGPDQREKAPGLAPSPKPGDAR